MRNTPNTTDSSFNGFMSNLSELLSEYDYLNSYIPKSVNDIKLTDLSSIVDSEYDDLMIIGLRK